jgi:RNA polymerase sigma-70 factor (sigma-E family)
VVSGDTRNGQHGRPGDAWARKPVITASEPGGPPKRPTTGTAAVNDAGVVVEELYRAHYRSLVGLAVLLVRDVGTAEEVVQDSFVAMHHAWQGLRDREKALAYLRQSVVNRSRSVLRRRVVADRKAHALLADAAITDHGAILDRSEVVAALRTLPGRQREVVVLKFYADMTEAQIAQTLQISQGAVKSHTSRAMTALRTVLAGDR